MSNAKFIIQGDMQRGTEALPVAVNFLKQARATGQTQLNKTFFFGDTKVRVVLNPYTGDRVYIEPAACPAVQLSGLVDTFESPATASALIDEQITAEYRTADVLDHKLSIGIRPIPKTATVLSALSGDGAPSDGVGEDGDIYVPTDTLDVYMKVSGAWIPLKTEAPDDLRLTSRLMTQSTIVTDDGLRVGASLFKETYESLKPSRFSGYMRQVMQATLGSSEWGVFVGTGAEVAKAPVSYKFGDSWGCLKRGGRWHFVRITETAAYYVPTEYCARVAVDTSGSDIDVVILRAANVSNAVKLCDIPAGTGQSWDTETGWAFSYGEPDHEASIVVYTEAAAGGMVVKHTSLLTIRFVFDAESGNLTSATFASTRPAPFFAPFKMRADLAGSRSLFNSVSVVAGVRQNVTVDFGLPDNRGTLDPPRFDPTAGNPALPVYVFYVKDRKKLVTFESDFAEGIIRSEARVSPTTGVNAGGATVADYTPLIRQTTWGTTANHNSTYTYGFSCDGSSFDKSDGSQPVDYYRLENLSDHPDRAGQPGAEYVEWSAEFYFIPDDPAIPPYNAGTKTSGQILSSSRNFECDVVQIVESIGPQTAHSILNIPVDDREAVVIYGSASRGGYSRSKTTTKWLGSQLAATPKWGTYNNSTSAGEDADVAAKLGSCGIAGKYTVYNVSQVFHTASGEIVTSFAAAPAGGNVNYNPSSYVYTNEVSNACGYSAYTKVAVSTVVSVPAQVVTTESVAPVATESLTAYGHTTVSLAMPFGLPQVYAVHPETEPLVCVFTQAAFDPSNYITHKTYMNGPLVVKFGDITYHGAEYDVGHRLVGWIGVA